MKGWQVFLLATYAFVCFGLAALMLARVGQLRQEAPAERRGP